MPLNDRIGVVRIGPSRFGAIRTNPSGTGHEPPLADDERAAVLRVGADELVAQPERPAEVDAPGLVGDERVGAAFEREPVDPVGPDRAADPVLALEHDDLDRPPRAPRALDDPVRRGQAREPRADDHDPVLVRRPLGQRGDSSGARHGCLGSRSKSKATPRLAVKQYLTPAQRAGKVGRMGSRTIARRGKGGSRPGLTSRRSRLDGLAPGVGAEDVQRWQCLRARSSAA